MVEIDVSADMPTVEPGPDVAVSFPGKGRVIAHEPRKLAAWRELLIAVDAGNQLSATVAFDGFLRHCLDPDDWADLVRMVDDPNESELDWQHLLYAGQRLMDVFRPSLQKRSEALGMALSPDAGEQDDSADADPVPRPQAAKKASSSRKSASQRG